MNIGTKSLLYGYHQFLLHPLCVALAWWRLYSFPWDPRLWVAFVVHDWGYWGKPNMDGAEGEKHPELGAAIMRRLFGNWWGDFCLLHSRFYAQKQGREVSRLCYADKHVALILPWWIQLPLMNATGEIREYMLGKNGRTAGSGSQRAWFQTMQQMLKDFIQAGKEGA